MRSMAVKVLAVQVTISLTYTRKYQAIVILCLMHAELQVYHAVRICK